MLGSKTGRVQRNPAKRRPSGAPPPPGVMPGSRGIEVDSILAVLCLLAPSFALMRRVEKGNVRLCAHSGLRDGKPRP
jgi:hypothetical protein